MKVIHNGTALMIHFTRTETQITVPPPKAGASFTHTNPLTALLLPQTSVLAMPQTIMAPSMACTIHDAAEPCNTVFEGEGVTRKVLEPCTLESARGVSICRPPDVWNQTVGCKLAMTRALKAYPIDARHAVWQKFLVRQPRVLSHQAMVKRMLHAAHMWKKVPGTPVGTLGQELLDILKQSGRLS